MVPTTRKNKKKIYIGTSGWVYSHWKEVFYPSKLSSSDYLKFYSRQFNTTEINYSFYHLPRPATFQKWYQQTPKGFVFSVKASRFITHIKRLKNVEEAWSQFIENALNLKEKLGPILFQFPPSFKANRENIQRLKEFLKLLANYSLPTTHYSLLPTHYPLKYAFEFRHKTWIDKKVFDLLKKYNASWVISDSSHYPKSETTTADFIYIRMHGPGALFASKYSKQDLKKLAQKIGEYKEQGKDVFVYFNNDFYGYAIDNAKELINLVN
ncbi:DUF72 domain-containing protein [bacterium]|nr:DUF72 domain-containing protein [bacterium]